MGKRKNTQGNSESFLNLIPAMKVSDEHMVYNSDEIERKKSELKIRSTYHVVRIIEQVFNPRKTAKSRQDDLERARFYKSNYILCHLPNGDFGIKPKALLMLAADRDLIFFDRDSSSLDYHLNKLHRSARNLQLKSPTETRKSVCRMICASPRWSLQQEFDRWMWHNMYRVLRTQQLHKLYKLYRSRKLCKLQELRKLHRLHGLHKLHKIYKLYRVHRLYGLHEISDNKTRRRKVVYSNIKVLRKSACRIFLCEILLDEIAKKQRPYEWLYQKDHIRCSEEIIEKIVEDEDIRNYYIQYIHYKNGRHNDLNIEFPEIDVDKCRAFISYTLERKAPYDTWLLDYEKCAESLRREFKRRLEFMQGVENKWFKMMTSNFCEYFIDYYLTEYIHTIQKNKIETPRVLPHKSRENKVFQGFIERYYRLVKLCDKWDEEPPNEQEKFKTGIERFYTYLEKDGVKYWGKRTPSKDDADPYEIREAKENKEIGEALQIFMTNLGCPFKPEKQEELIKRIVWVREYSESNVMTVFMLFKMILKFGPALPSNRKLLCKTDEMFEETRFYKSIPKEKLRYEMIILIAELQKILNLEANENKYIWNVFLSYKGKEILSTDEAKFWKQLLETQYEDIPWIGFQLCFVDYTEKCMYLTRSSLRTCLNGALLFGHIKVKGKSKDCKFAIKGTEEHSKRKALLSKCDKCKGFKYKEVSDLIPIIESSKNLYSSFCKIWKNPENNKDICYMTLKSFLSEFENCELMNECPNETYKIAELEVALRLFAQSKAKEKMYAWFNQFYGCSLKYIADAYYLE